MCRIELDWQDVSTKTYSSKKKNGVLTSCFFIKKNKTEDRNEKQH